MCERLLRISLSDCFGSVQAGKSCHLSTYGTHLQGDRTATHLFIRENCRAQVLCFVAALRGDAGTDRGDSAGTGTHLVVELSAQGRRYLGHGRRQHYSAALALELFRSILLRTLSEAQVRFPQLRRRWAYHSHHVGPLRL